MISFLWYENSQKVTKKSQNLLKVLPKTVLFRNIALIFSLEKPCYLENRVVREPCKRRSACIHNLWDKSLQKKGLHNVTMQKGKSFMNLLNYFCRKGNYSGYFWKYAFFGKEGAKMCAAWKMKYFSGYFNLQRLCKPLQDRN